MGLLVGGGLSEFGVISCSLLGLLDDSLFALLFGCLRLWLDFYHCVGLLGGLVCDYVFVCCVVMFWVFEFCGFWFWWFVICFTLVEC